MNVPVNGHGIQNIPFYKDTIQKDKKHLWNVINTFFRQVS